MSRFNKNENAPIEWETVRRNKTTPKEANNISAAGGGRQISTDAAGGGNENQGKKNTDEMNQNYVPRAIRDELDKILYSSDAVQTKIKLLRDKIYEFIRYKRSRDIDWKTRLNIYVIHRVCKMNKQEILSAIIDSCDDVSKYVNAISSTLSGNTCLFDAIYYGSDQCINILLNRGANIHHVNKAGETAYNLLETGRADYIKRHPGKDIFINERFGDCLRLIKAADEEKKMKEEKEKKDEAVAVAVAVSVAGEESSSVSSSVLSPVLSEGAEFFNESDDSDDHSASTKNEEITSKFRDTYDEESMKKAFTKHIEIIQDFKDFIKHVKEKLKLNDLLKTILEDEDIQDLFEDNPYARNIV